MLLIAALLAAVSVAEGPYQQPPPPVPAWPDQFTIELEILVEKYGPNWNSSGALYYDWKSKVNSNHTQCAHIHNLAQK
jgi:hypothetical protein